MDLITKKIEYKGFKIEIDLELIDYLEQFLKKESATFIMLYIIKNSTWKGYTLSRFHDVATTIRNLFFAMKPDNPEYEKVRLFFEFSNCLIDNIEVNNNSRDIDLAIYVIIIKLRNIFLTENP